MKLNAIPLNDWWGILTARNYATEGFNHRNIKGLGYF